MGMSLTNEEHAAENVAEEDGLRLFRRTYFAMSDHVYHTQ
jgi:hypothetical protein